VATNAHERRNKHQLVYIEKVSNSHQDNFSLNQFTSIKNGVENGKRCRVCPALEREEGIMSLI